MGKYGKRSTMRVVLTRSDGGVRDGGSSVPMPWPRVWHRESGSIGTVGLPADRHSVRVRVLALGALKTEVISPRRDSHLHEEFHAIFLVGIGG